MIATSVYNQGDPRWGSKMMKPSGLRMADFGCMVTAFASGIKNYAISDDPGQVCDKFVSAGVFDQNGNFIQQNVSRVYQHLFHKERIYTTMEPNPAVQKMSIDVALARVRKYLDRGQPVLLNVDLVGQDKNADHWVLAYDYTSSDFSINDPAFGDSIMFSKRYGSPTTAVYGYSVFIGQPIEVPSTGDAGLGAAMAKLAEAKAGINVTQNVSEALDSLV